MSGSPSLHQGQPLTAAEHMRLGSYNVAAQQMVNHLGTMAIGCAIDQQIQARMAQDQLASRFWERVSGHILVMQTAVPVSR